MGFTTTTADRNPSDVAKGRLMSAGLLQQRVQQNESDQDVTKD